jgi:hypothetical protein
MCLLSLLGRLKWKTSHNKHRETRSESQEEIHSAQIEITKYQKGLEKRAKGRSSQSQV